MTLCNLFICYDEGARDKIRHNAFKVRRVTNLQTNSKKHWLVLIAMCGLAVTGAGLPVMSNGVFITPIADALGVYRGSVAMHNTMTLVFKAILSLYAPVLIHKYSFKKVITAGVLLVGVTNYLIGLTDQIWLFNVLGMLRGVGAGLLAWVPLTMIINQWFEKKHGLVTSIVLSFSSIAGAIFSPIFTTLIGVLGWAQTNRIMGLIAILFGLPAIFLKYTLDPRDSGYLPYGHEPARETHKESRGIEFSTASDLYKVSYVVFGLFMLFALFQTMLTGITQHYPGFAGTIGLSINAGATLMSVTMISSIGFKLLIGWLSDYIGPVKGSLWMLVVMGAGLLLLTISPNLNVLLIGAFLFGAAYTMPSVGVALLTRHFFGVHMYPRLYPRIAFSTSLGSGIAISAIGYIYDYTGSYQPAFVIALVLLVFDLFVLLFVSYKTRKDLQPY